MINQDLKNIILEHLQRYPKMTTQDAIKLIFQQTFGPGHYSSDISPKDISRSIFAELVNLKIYDETPHIESIGNGYYRVSLKAISRFVISIDEMTKMFYFSMKNTAKSASQFKDVFMNKLDDLMALVHQQIVIFDDVDAIKEIKTYINQGIRATHHSACFKQLYHPHYRVIHQSLMSADLIQKCDFQFESAT